MVFCRDRSDADVYREKDNKYLKRKPNLNESMCALAFKVIFSISNSNLFHIIS